MCAAREEESLEMIPLRSEPNQPTNERRRRPISERVRQSAGYSLLSKYSCIPPPWFTITISITQVVIFGVYVAELSKQDIQVTWERGYPAYSPLVYRPDKRQEVWRFLTYMFIHNGWQHVVFNIFLQLLVGIPLEMIHTWRVIPIYLLGVITGSLAHSWIDHYKSLVGASGGVYALYGAHIAAIIMNWRESRFRWLVCVGSEGDTCPQRCRPNSRELHRFFLSGPAMLIYTLILVVPETCVAIYRRFGGDKQIGISAHFGGLLCGLLLGVRILKNIYQLNWEKIVGSVFYSVYIALVVACILFNIFYKGYPETDWG